MLLTLTLSTRLNLKLGAIIAIALENYVVCGAPMLVRLG